MQRLLKQSLSAALLAGVCLTALWSQNMGTKGSQLVWAPKPINLTPWVAPGKPHWKLSGILAAHKGQKTWTEPIVDDEFLHAEYIQSAPGDKTPRRAHPDTREWWVVWDGEIRFTIDGVEPFVAKKGFLVQVPYRTFYTMETLGDKPSLRFEVNIAKARTMYPVDVTPPALAGFKFERRPSPARASGIRATSLISTSTRLRQAKRRLAALLRMIAPSRTSSTETRRNWLRPVRTRRVIFMPNVLSSGLSCWVRSAIGWKACRTSWLTRAISSMRRGDGSTFHVLRATKWRAVWR